MFIGGAARHTISSQTTRTTLWKRQVEVKIAKKELSLRKSRKKFFMVCLPIYYAMASFYSWLLPLPNIVVVTDTLFCYSFIYHLPSLSIYIFVVVVLLFIFHDDDTSVVYQVLVLLHIFSCRPRKKYIKKNNMQKGNFLMGKKAPWFLRWLVTQLYSQRCLT